MSVIPFVLWQPDSCVELQALSHGNAPGWQFPTMNDIKRPPPFAPSLLLDPIVFQKPLCSIFGRFPKPPRPPISPLSSAFRLGASLRHSWVINFTLSLFLIVIKPLTVQVSHDARSFFTHHRILRLLRTSGACGPTYPFHYRQTMIGRLFDTAYRLFYPSGLPCT